MFEGAHCQNAAKGETHQIEAVKSQFVRELSYQFGNLLAGKSFAKRSRFSMPGQFKEIHMEPLRHELSQWQPVLQLRYGGGHYDKRLAFPRFQHMQAR